MGFKGSIENKLGLNEWSKLEQRLIAEMEDAEALLAKANGRKLDPGDYENTLKALDKAEVDARQDLWAASSRGDGEACKAKGELQTRAQRLRARLVGNQCHGVTR